MGVGGVVPKLLAVDEEGSKLPLGEKLRAQGNGVQNIVSEVKKLSGSICIKSCELHE